MKIVLNRESFDSRRTDLTTIAPAAKWVLINDDGTADGDPADCEILFVGADIFHNKPRITTFRELRLDPSLEWIQGPSAGVDSKIWSSLLARGVRLTNASGIYAEPMSQYVTAWVLAWAQGIGGQMLRSQHHEWSRVEPQDLTSATMGIIGYGGVGKACARHAKALGMRVLATRRTPGTEPNVDQLMAPDRLHDLLGEADYVVIAAPLTDDTDGLIGEAEFAAMSSRTVLINVARGRIVDEDALAHALSTGIICGATTDVTCEEPLPPESSLWDLPNLVITPHQSAESPRSQERLDDLFVDNLGRYVNHEPLLNEVTDTHRSS